MPPSVGSVEGDSCLKEIEDLPAVKKYGQDVKVSMYMYDRPAWTGTVYETECFFPTWINKETGISLSVRLCRNWVTSADLFSSLYSPGTAAYTAAQVTSARPERAEHLHQDL